MTRYENQTFENEHLVLDEVVFINCIFKNCSLEYAGGDTHVQNCQGDGCQLVWRGAAQRTVRRCCTNWFGRGLALRRLSLLSDDSAGLRLAQLGHPVQYVTPHHRLSLLRFVGARPKAVSEHALIPQEEILDAGLSATP